MNYYQIFQSSTYGQPQQPIQYFPMAPPNTPVHVEASYIPSTSTEFQEHGPSAHPVQYELITIFQANSVQAPTPSFLLFSTSNPSPIFTTRIDASCSSKTVSCSTYGCKKTYLEAFETSRGFEDQSVDRMALHKSLSSPPRLRRRAPQTLRLCLTIWTHPLLELVRRNWSKLSFVCTDKQWLCFVLCGAHSNFGVQCDSDSSSDTHWSVLYSNFCKTIN